jgi:hypothetical protein
MPDLAGRFFGDCLLLKTFLTGIVLGLLATAGALYAIPIVDHAREESLISVAPNGGNMESFHVNIPADRIMIGAPGQQEPLPPGMDWPQDALLADVRTELFKIRNARDVVVGIAIRNAASLGNENVIDWVLHLPARGSLFINMQSAPSGAGYRTGKIRSGSRELGPLQGVMLERWVADTSGEKDAPLGRIELQATYAGKPEPAQ